MPAKKQDLTIEQGTTWSHGWLVRYTATGDVDDLAPIDDTWTVAAQVRKGHGDADPLYTFFSSVDDSGAVVIGVPHGDSEDWTWRTGYYDVEVTNAGGTVRLRVAEGRVNVKPEVTRG